MATTQTAATAVPAAVKRPGPPVPPRPQHTSATAKTQRAASAAAASPTSSAGGRVVLPTATPEPPVIQKKPTLTTQNGAGGRTIIYKSPSLNLQGQEAEQLRRASNGDAVNGSTAGRTNTMAPKPPLKLRKAPDVPTARPKITESSASPTSVSVSNARNKSSEPVNNIVIVQASNAVSLNRHHSMSSPKTTNLKDTRLSLGRADFEKVGKIQLDQLQPGLPLPKPRKIVKVPVATLDIDEVPSTTSSTTVSLFRRSKTTLDNLTSRTNVTTISTGTSTNGFLGGKTAEIKNNLKNAAERLFSEIIVNQQKQAIEQPATIITKHERAVQHQALLEQDLVFEREKRMAMESHAQGPTITVVTTSAVKETAANTTRINVNATLAGNSPTKNIQIGSVLKSPEKKAAFHEILISELAAMRSKSLSMENLQSKELSLSGATANSSETAAPCQRRNSVEDHDLDAEDVDADNVEDAEGDDDDLNKTLKESTTNSPRKRCPSGCSSDSSPYGTERSARIRTSDWIEVGDNGKEVTMTSCHISLEDSGLEDEERLDDMSSSGVGDSWDSVKEAENVKRCRSVKRVMSITDLPPLPKSLSGINKMLGSDSGLLSDADANVEANNNSNNNNKNKLECQKDNAINDNASNNGNSNNNNCSSNAFSINNEKREMSALEANGNAVDNKINAPTAATKENSTTTKTTTPTTTTTTTKTITSPPLKAPESPIANSTLDTQLAILRKEMYGLRQLDLSLLSQLWALNDSIQEFRTMLEEQDQDPESFSPHSPTPSSYDSVSSDGEEDVPSGKKQLSTNAKIITTQPKLATSNSCDMPNALLQSRADDTLGPGAHQKRPALPKPLDTKPVPRMRSAPPPPPANRKSAAPPRPT